MLKPEERYAVFIDIDGTLIADKFTVPQRNLDAIAAARAKGHMVFINTGRSWGNIPEVLRNQLDIDGYVVGSGSMITVGGETVYRTALGEDLLKRLTEYAFEHREFWYVFEGLNRVYALSNEIRKRESFQISLESVEDYKLMNTDDEIQVIAMGKEISEEFKETFKDEITVFQFSYYADLVIKGLNKAVGIQKVLEKTGIKKENTIAIGDSNNDYDMIKFAGIGVAMANSQQRIIDAADYVTDSNFDCGVAKAIEKFLL